MSRLSNEIIDEILRLNERGISNSDIAKTVHVAQFTVSRVIYNGGRVTGTYHGEKFSEETPKTFIRPKAVYNNSQPFEYRLPVREKRI